MSVCRLVHPQQGGPHHSTGTVKLPLMMALVHLGVSATIFRQLASPPFASERIAAKETVT